MESIRKLTTENLIQKLPQASDVTVLLKCAKKSGLLVPLLKQLIIEEEKNRLNINEMIADEEWREERWGDQAEEAFIENKNSLIRYSFWALTMPQKDLTMEYYYQLSSNEVNFPDLSKHIGGIVFHSNVDLRPFPKQFKLALVRAKVNVPQAPFQIGENHCIVELESLQNPSLTAEVRKKILIFLEDNWVSRELSRRFE